MTIKEMQDRKRELGYTNQMIADLSGIPLGTVQKIFAGCTKAPRRRTIEILEKALSDPQKKTGESAGDVQSRTRERSSQIYQRMAPAMTICEPESVYASAPKQGHYTLEDYYALPDTVRAELIDGYLYDMAAPTTIHQTILTQVWLQLFQCTESHPGCRAFAAPLDVRLDNDDFTMVQPDLLIICGRNDGDTRRINGAPDFIVEILSPSNRYHDMYRKLNKYRLASVREYWIIDPEKKRVTVYDFEHDDLPVTYRFTDRVPVLISGGECFVDFVKVDDVLKRYTETESASLPGSGDV